MSNSFGVWFVGLCCWCLYTIMLLYPLQRFKPGIISVPGLNHYTSANRANCLVSARRYLGGKLGTMYLIELWHLCAELCLYTVASILNSCYLSLSTADTFLPHETQLAYFVLVLLFWSSKNMTNIWLNPTTFCTDVQHSACSALNMSL